MASSKINSIDLGPIWVQSGLGNPDHIGLIGTQYTDLDTALVYTNVDGFNTWDQIGGGGPSTDTYVSGMSFNNLTYDLTLNRNDGVSLSQNLSILAKDIYVTGGTYSAGTAIFTNNTGGGFSVTGFSTGNSSQQYEVSTSQNALPEWNGNTVIFTSACTITIPSSLPSEYSFNGITLNNVSVFLGITSPFTWAFGPPTKIHQRQMFNVIRQGSSNNILFLKISMDNYSDAEKFIIAANITDPTEQTAIYTLVDSLIANNLWDKLFAIYPFVGSSGYSHKFNLKAPIDDDISYRLTFTGGSTHSSLGYQCDGTSWANTYFNPNLIQDVNSNGITITVGTNNATISSDAIEIGSYTNGTTLSFVGSKRNNTNYTRYCGMNSNTGRIELTGTNDARGIYSGNRFGGNTKLIRNGMTLATIAASGALPSSPIYIGTLNLAPLSLYTTTQRIQFTSLHSGLSDSELVTFHSIIDTFENSLGRKTW